MSRFLAGPRSKRVDIREPARRWPDRMDRYPARRHAHRSSSFSRTRPFVWGNSAPRPGAQRATRDRGRACKARPPGFRARTVIRAAPAARRRHERIQAKARTLEGIFRGPLSGATARRGKSGHRSYRKRKNATSKSNLFFSFYSFFLERFLAHTPAECHSQT